jgi:tripartite-type tricarboxylate transporter receptor subunit TctC
VKERIVQIGSEPVGNSPEEFTAFIKSEFAVWAKVVKEVGITMD